MGLVSPVGCGVPVAWENVKSGISGAGKIEHFRTDDLKCKVAAMIPKLDGEGGGGPDIPGTFDPDAVMSAKERRRIDEFILYAIAASDEAINDSGWHPSEDENEARERTGVLYGSGVGGLKTTYEGSLLLDGLDKGGGRPKKISPFIIPGMLINLAAGQISIRHGFKGPNHSVVTACATGAHAIGDAARLIQRGDADVMIAGGSESSICRLGLAGFIACRAMTTNFNDEPERASRPYDKDRDGFLMGEGAGAVVLEEYEHAKARGATIYAEFKGYGMSGDAHHITSPAPEGEGGYRAMKAALNDSGLDITDIGYVNAHGTSTPLGDELEVMAVERLFGEHSKNVKMSATKSMTGHLLGAAGALEAILAIMALKDQVAPPTINLDNPSLETEIDLVPHEAKPINCNAVMSNSFGFGGTNAALIFAKAPQA